MLLSGAAAGAACLCYQPGTDTPVAERTGSGIFVTNGQITLPGLAQHGGRTPLATATAAGAARAASTPQSSAGPAARNITRSGPAAGRPLAGGGHAGTLLLSDPGSRLTAWDRTAATCPELPFPVMDGTVGTDAGGDATLSVSGPGSCAALVSPGRYASAVIEAEVDLPALPGHPGTVANWIALWMSDESAWPVHGELDAVEIEPFDGVNAASWHSGTRAAQFVASTDGFFPVKLPVSAPNLTPGWHTVDVVYTRGFFAVYYDGREFTSYTADQVTGEPLNIYLTMTVTPDVSAARQLTGGPPVNSDSSPATFAVKYLRIWSYR